MPIALLRKDSETPNIQNSDDCRMFRYALGGKDGVTLNYGESCSYTINGSTFTVNSGEISVGGYQAIIDALGESVTVTTAVGTFYYAVYIEVDLRVSSNQTATIKSIYSTGVTPSISTGDDLTQNPSGVARLLLYTFTVTNGTISNVTRHVESLSYSGPRLSALETRATNLEGRATALETRATNLEGRATALETRATNLEMADRQIVARLNALGFRSATTSVAGVSGYTVKRQGNYVIANWAIPVYVSQSVAQTYFANGATLFSLPVNFRPNSAQSIGISVVSSGVTPLGHVLTATINTNGACVVSNNLGDTILLSNVNILVSFGFEAPAIS